jgi:hypothetical protein
MWSNILGNNLARVFAKQKQNHYNYKKGASKNPSQSLLLYFYFLVLATVFAGETLKTRLVQQT